MSSGITSSGYLLPVNIRQTAATVAPATVWTMRNLNDIAIIRQIHLCVGFDPAAGAAVIDYRVGRFRGATPTGGTALVVQKAFSQAPASAVLDARFLDSGLTVAGVIFDQEIMECRGEGNGAVARYDFVAPHHTPLSLDLNDGLCIRLMTTATIGQWIAGWVYWEEQ